MERYARDLQQADVALRRAAKESSSHEGSIRELLTTWVTRSKNETLFLEYILSALEENMSAFLGEWIIDHFPLNAGAFATRMWNPLLSSLSQNLYAILPDDPDDLHRRLGRVQTAIPVLDVVSTNTFPDSCTGGTNRHSRTKSLVEEDEDDVDDDPFLVNIAVKRKSQRQNKQSRGKRAKKSADVGPQLTATELNAFRHYGVEVPRTRTEAEELVRTILLELQESLKTYLEILRRPEVLEAVCAAIDRPSTPTHESEDVHIASPERPRATQDTEAPAAYPMVQPMKAALYFDNAEGFGEWRILISTRADKTLRETRNKEQKTFKVIVNKIKDLSNGHFSDDNQKRLNGPETDIPIFEAKMTRDLRLVYQVDCVPEFGTEGERQALKIFGIYTHAKLDQRFWNSVGNQLSKKGGKEYKYRCTYRMKPLARGDNVYLPASFPPAEPLSAVPTTELPSVRTEDLDELHALLVLEKFVTFSQAFLNSLLANQDVVHPFAVSSQEQEIIEHPHSCYVIGRSGTGKTTTMLFKMLGLERTWQQHRDSMPRPRQVFVTQSRVLAGKVEEYFAKMLESLAAGGHSPKELKELAASRGTHDEGLVDLDDEDNWRSDLPKKYSELRDEHFPLFVTYDRLCRLLEADYSQIGVKLNAVDEDDEQAESNEYMLQTRDAFVSYTVFLQTYWPHFPQSLTKGLDPALVFSEFLGIIKGSEKALLCEERCLDKSTYDELSHRSQSTFARQRQVIYSLFQVYTKRRIESRHYDGADRTQRILRALQDHGVPGKKINYLYVDEVQDNLLIDILVLRMLCVNVNGLFFAGDTAQTISVGSSFRFNDLKAFMYRVEERGRSSTASSTEIIQPRSFQLLVNYRSHGGIVTCASSIIRLITRFWPYAIDMLDEEKGVIDGLKPVFFHGWDKDSVRYEQFLFGETGAPIEFGAQQCILVRNEAARQRLREEVGDIGLILTLYESKGLEFNDVLLFNFFEDSTVDVSQWRVVLNALDERARKGVTAPRFDETRHAGVCNELKFLYVAATRARKNLWIADSSERSEPIRMLWTSTDLVESFTPGTDVPRLAVSSSSEEWAATAASLFKSKRYMQAMHAYERADKPREMAVAHAYHLREQARALTSGTPKLDAARREAFAKAADAFVACAEKARKEKLAYFRVAGRCYLDARDEAKAARSFLQAEEYTLATQHFRNAGLFDEAVDVLHNHGHSVDADTSEKIKNVARVHYFREEQLDKARRLFDTIDEQLEFAEDHDFDVARAKLLEAAGELVQAAKLHQSEGRALEAIRLFLADIQEPSSSRRAAAKCILEQLWAHLSLGMSAKSEHSVQAVPKLLSLSNQLDPASLDEKDVDEITMFRAVVGSDHKRLQQLSRKFVLQTKNYTAALRSLDPVCSTVPANFQSASLSEASEILQVFLAYVRLLRELNSGWDLCEKPTVLRLFGVRALDENLFFVPAETYLHGRLIQRPPPSMQIALDGVSVKRITLSSVMTQSLASRLKLCIMALDELARRARAFSICVAYAHMPTGCRVVDCQRQHPPARDKVWFNARVGLHLQQILIIQPLLNYVGNKDRGYYQRDWLGRLFDCIFPPVAELGSVANLSVLSMVEGIPGMRVVKEWIRDTIYNFGGPGVGPKRLPTEVVRAYLLAMALDEDAAKDYIRRAPCVQEAFRPPTVLLRSGMQGAKERISVLHDLYARQDGSMGPWFSALAFKHLVEEDVTMDISVLCALAEDICATMIIIASTRRHPPLHDLTLPRSWIARFAHRFLNLAAKDPNLPLLPYIAAVQTLLRKLLQPTGEHLSFQGRTLDMMGIPLISAFLLRLLRALCFLGYNLRDTNLRERIYQSIASVRPNRTVPRCDQYFQAKGWSELVRFVRSQDPCPLDDMVQLFHSSKPIAGNPPLGRLHRIVFTFMPEVSQLLGVERVATSVSKLRGGATPFVPGSLLSKAISGITPSVKPVPDKVPDIPRDTTEPEDVPDDTAVGEEDDEQDGADTTVDAEALASALGNEQRGEKAAQGPNEEEISKATCIQRAYRRSVRRRPAGGAEEMQAVFLEYLAQSKQMDWPLRHYRFLYLGPLPHLVVCLKRIQSYAQKEKRRIKAQINKVDHRELDNLAERQTQMNKLNKSAKKLEEALRPTADIHRQRNEQLLKTLVLQAEALVKTLPTNSGRDISEDL